MQNSLRISKLVLLLRFDQKLIEKIEFKVTEGEIRCSTLYIHSAILAVDAGIGSIWSCRAELYVDIKKLSQNHDEMFYIAITLRFFAFKCIYVLSPESFKKLLQEKFGRVSLLSMVA